MTEVPQSTEIGMAFALGELNVSYSFIAVLPEQRKPIMHTALAFRILARLWKQYREDSSLSHGRTLVSADNSFEIRVFLALVEQYSSWAPLRAAAGRIRAVSPALLPHEQDCRDELMDQSLALCVDVADVIGRKCSGQALAATLDRLIEACWKFDEASPTGVCWALNLLCALDPERIGMFRGQIPSPSLLRREMFRVDRSRSWRLMALEETVSRSAGQSCADILDLFACFRGFDASFAELRRHSRLREAFVYLAGIGELSPAVLARLLRCSDPGARKMLTRLGTARLAVALSPSPFFAILPKFRHDVRRFQSVETPARPSDPLDFAAEEISN
jgi:hypothetical protein